MFSFELKKATLTINNNEEEIIAIKAIEKQGFQAKKNNTNNNQKDNQISSKTTNLNYITIICALLCLPLMLGMVAHNSIFSNPHFGMICSLSSYVFGSYYFGKSAYNSIVVKLLNMDVLVFSGIQLSFWFSVYNLFITHNNNYIFFEVTASIVAFVLIGNYIEKLALTKTKKQIDDLFKKKTYKAKKIVDSIAQETDIESLVINDQVLIATGDMIPCDGTLINSSIYVDESMITGESAPKLKKVNDEVFAGTIVTSGTATVQVNKAQTSNYINTILKLVDNTLLQKPKIQRQADIVAAWFVPLVGGIMILTFALNYWVLNNDVNIAILRSIAVGVIACPCAMGLATPTAILVGLGRAFNMGLLIKNVECIESLSKAQNFVFDKTGTLTDGAFAIQKIEILEGEKQDILNVIHALESHSSHPIAKKLVDLITATATINLTNIVENIGVGISAFNEKNEAIEIKKNNSNDTNSLVISLLINKKTTANIYLNDALKPNADKLFEYIKHNKINTFLLSGDHENRVLEIAKKLNITTYKAQQLPQEKLEYIHKIKQNKITVMIGDGVNDAPALSSADVGISFSNANDIALHSADIILLDGDLLKIKHVHLLSKIIVNTINQNLLWALAYNIIALPIAAFGVLNPMWACACMAISDVVVIGNSWLIKYKKIN
jgi:Cu+-exporting ATPase